MSWRECDLPYFPGFYHVPSPAYAKALPWADGGHGNGNGMAIVNYKRNNGSGAGGGSGGGSGGGGGKRSASRSASPPLKKLSRAQLTQIEECISGDDAVGLRDALTRMGADPLYRAGLYDASFIHFAAQESAVGCVTALLNMAGPHPSPSLSHGAPAHVMTRRPHSVVVHRHRRTHLDTALPFHSQADILSHNKRLTRRPPSSSTQAAASCTHTFTSAEVLVALVEGRAATKQRRSRVSVAPTKHLEDFKQFKIPSETDKKGSASVWPGAKGVSPNLCDNRGEAPLHWVTFACDERCVQTAELLLERGAHVDHRSAFTGGTHGSVSRHFAPRR